MNAVYISDGLMNGLQGQKHVDLQCIEVLSCISYQ